MASTVFQLSDAGAVPRVDWLHVDSGTSGGTDGKIAIIQAAVDDEDADGNPTPDAAAFPPADFPQGSLFYPTSYPGTLNSGADTFGGGGMVFRRTGGAGSEAWTWIEGSFWASNSNGNYQRDADGWQICTHEQSAGGAVNTAAGSIFRTGSATWNFPAAFSPDAPEVIPNPKSGIANIWAGIGSAGPTTTTGSFAAFSATSSGTTPVISLLAEGRWKA